MSFKNELTLNEARIKSAGAYLAAQITEFTGQKFSHMNGLQLISEALFSKSFEEIKALIERDAQAHGTESKQSVAGFNPVFVVNYADQAYLFDGVQMFHNISGGINHPINNDGIIYRAKQVSHAYGFSDEIRVVALPSILGPTPSTDDIQQLCQKMGYMDYEFPLIDLLSSYQVSHTKLNGHYSPHLLNGDWENDLISEVDDNDGSADDISIWFAECQEGMDMYEFDFSFAEICAAKKINDSTWSAKSGELEVIIELF